MGASIHRKAAAVVFSLFGFLFGIGLVFKHLAGRTTADFIAATGVFLMAFVAMTAPFSQAAPVVEAALNRNVPLSTGRLGLSIWTHGLFLISAARTFCLAAEAGRYVIATIAMVALLGVAEWLTYEGFTARLSARRTRFGPTDSMAYVLPHGMGLMFLSFLLLHVSSLRVMGAGTLGSAIAVFISRIYFNPAATLEVIASSAPSARIAKLATVFVVFPVLVRVIYILVSVPLIFIVSTLPPIPPPISVVVSGAIVIASLMTAGIGAFQVCRKMMWPKTDARASAAAS